MSTLTTILAAATALIIGPLAVLMLAAGFLCLRSVWRDFARCDRGFAVPRPQ